MMPPNMDAGENIAERIYQQVKTMPLAKARDVLDLISFLQFKQTPAASPPANNADLIKFIQELPKGNRDAADIDKEFRALRDEWGQP